jgi:hypothetical protein
LVNIFNIKLALTTNLFLAANLSSAKSMPAASKTNELGNENSAEVKI